MTKHLKERDLKEFKKALSISPRSEELKKEIRERINKEIESLD